tara:strand:+ start:108 stop:371 length:264 start_codon:yes stop_codon:yes gene_type:complete
MTQYKDRVERQRLKLEADEWAYIPKTIHAHSLNSMWYAIDRNDGSVLDICYNNGEVKRTINKTGEVVWLGKQLKGDELIRAYVRGGN